MVSPGNGPRFLEGLGKSQQLILFLVLQGPSKGYWPSPSDGPDSGLENGQSVSFSFFGFFYCYIFLLGVTLVSKNYLGRSCTIL